MSDDTDSIWYRVRYKMPHWPKGRVKLPGGFARHHWTRNKAQMERLAADTIAKGGEAYVEESPAHGPLARS